MSIPVLEVARKGYDLNTCNDRYKTIASEKNQFKVEEEGSGVFNFEARGASNTYQKLYVDIVHNLGYQPSFTAQAKTVAGDWKQNPVMNVGTTAPTKWCTGIDRLDENTIRLYCYVFDPTLDAHSAFDIDYEYIIFVDPNKDV